MSSGPGGSGGGTLTGVSVLPAPSIQLARSLAATSVEDLARMSPYELFQKQIDTGSTEASLDAMKRLSVVAVTLGPEKIKSELLPYLTVLATAQPPPSDEWLLLLGQEIGYVAKYCGVDSVEVFLPILERLAAVEETVVRDEAVRVIGELATGAPNSTAPIWMALIKRLVNADWFTPKVSAAGIIPFLFRLVTTANASELLSLYKDLCTDETPMVRRAAAQHLGKALKESGWNHRDEGIAIQTLTRLCNDEQDSVRRLAVVALADAGTQYGQQNPQWTAQHWLPLVKEASTDLSWRVRHNLAKHFSDVATNLGIQRDRRLVSEQSLVMACFVTLLTDAEAEVRAAAVGHLAQMVAWGGPTHFSTHLQPLLPALADDVVMEVRSKCALALMDAAHGGTLEDQVILASFGPLLEAFLQDEFHEVQLQVLTNLHKISHLLPGLGGVVTSLLQMSKASNWRVRQAVAQLLPHLAEARGIEFFTSVLLEPAWLTLLLDTVSSVRQAIVEGMPLLIKVAGDEWIQANLLPHHLKIFNQHSTAYLMRITILQSYIYAGTAARPPLFPEVANFIMRTGLNDKVANVRMVAAHGLRRIVKESPIADTVASAQFRPALQQKIKEEEDIDVRQACQLALDSIK